MKTNIILKIVNFFCKLAYRIFGGIANGNIKDEFENKDGYSNEIDNFQRDE